MSQHQVKRDRGVALLAALWLVILVVGATGVLLVPLRTSRLQVRNHLTRTMARQEAGSGLVHAVRLLQESMIGHEPAHLGPESVVVRLERARTAFERLGRTAAPGGGAYELSISDESARLPLNSASEARLLRLLLEIGAGSFEAVELAAAIADRKDPDDLHRLNGAEWDDYYSKLPGAARPPNAPFTSLSELADVRGVTTDLYARLEPLLTVASGTRVNLNSAASPVLAALPGLNRTSARQIAIGRRSGAVFASIEDVVAVLDAPARERLRVNYAEFRRLVTFSPETYQIVSVGYPPGQGHPVTLQARVAVNGARVSVLNVSEGGPP